MGVRLRSRDDCHPRRLDRRQPVDCRDRGTLGVRTRGIWTSLPTKTFYRSIFLVRTSFVSFLSTDNSVFRSVSSIPQRTPGERISRKRDLVFSPELLFDLLSLWSPFCVTLRTSYTNSLDFCSDSVESWDHNGLQTYTNIHHFSRVLRRSSRGHFIGVVLVQTRHFSRKLWRLHKIWHLKQFKRTRKCTFLN